MGSAAAWALRFVLLLRLALQSLSFVPAAGGTYGVGGASADGVMGGRGPPRAVADQQTRRGSAPAPTSWRRRRRRRSAMGGERLGEHGSHHLAADGGARGADGRAQPRAGLPGLEPADFVRAAGAAVLAPDSNPALHQYTRTAGHPRLVSLLAARYGIHFNRHVDALDEVSVTVGATQALYLCLQALLRPGDEVLVLEPYFDLYIGQIKANGGVPVPVLRLDDETGWQLDEAALAAAVTPRTRVVIVNTPHNPTGMVMSRPELESSRRSRTARTST